MRPTHLAGILVDESDDFTVFSAELNRHCTPDELRALRNGLTWVPFAEIKFGDTLYDRQLDRKVVRGRLRDHRGNSRRFRIVRAESDRMKRRQFVLFEDSGRVSIMLGPMTCNPTRHA